MLYFDDQLLRRFLLYQKTPEKEASRYCNQEELIYLALLFYFQTLTLYLSTRYSFLLGLQSWRKIKYNKCK